MMKKILFLIFVINTAHNTFTWDPNIHVFCHREDPILDSCKLIGTYSLGLSTICDTLQ